MEEQASALLALLKRSSAPIDQKITLFNKVKSDIKHLRVPEAAQPTIFECLRLAISAQTSPTLVSTGLSTLPHFIKRLNLQEQTGIIAQQTPKFLPVLLERLGDSRESHRNSASQSLADLWHYNHVEVEKVIKEGAVAGNNARAKEMGMMWIVKMNQEQSLQFKSFVPTLVACLEDADGMVRETAKSVVVELFSSAPERAKQDLQKQMAAKDVRKTIVTFIVQQLGIGNSVDLDMGTSTVTAPNAHGAHHLPEPAFGESAMAESASDAAQVEPLYVHSQRDLDDIFRDMHPHFEGRESEHNWIPRDKSIAKLRRLVVGNAPSDFQQAFMAGIKNTLEGILKVANSLRTTHSTSGCLMIQDLAKVLGPALDPLVDIIIQNFIKMSANTKPIAANNGSVTTDLLISNASYNKRLMEHVWFAFQDKNVQIRTYASGWLKTLLSKHARNRSQIEHSGGLELAEKSLKKGLADANPKVREGTRATYWAFAQIWAPQAGSIIESLDAKSRQLLEKDPHNPHATSMTSSMSSTTSGATAKTKPAAFNGRQSVREAIAAQKKAMAAKIERPVSAQSFISTTSAAGSTAAAPSAPRPAPGRGLTAKPSSSSLANRASANAHAPSSSASGSLMAAPVRRARRPEPPRPATADPYAQRRPPSRATPNMSPANSPAKTKTTVLSKSTSRTSVAPGPKTPTTESTVRSKSRLGQSSLPRPSPKSKSGMTNSPLASPRQDSFSVPFSRPPNDDEALPLRSAPRRPVPDNDSSADASLTFEDADNFTMVGVPGLTNYRSQAFDSRPTSRDRPTSSSSSQSRPAAISERPSPVKSAMQAHSNSPLNRLRSPVMTRSPPPASVNSQLRTSDSAQQTVQIYEDPLTEDDALDSDDDAEEMRKPVLEELPLNERAPNQDDDSEDETMTFARSTRSNEQNIEASATPRSSGPRSHHKTTSTGSIIGVNNTPGTLSANMTKNADVYRSRKLLASGIERIRNRTLDAHGFRRVQDIVKNGGDIWGDDKEMFSRLLEALLKELETPADSSRTIHAPTTAAGVLSKAAPTTPSSTRTANFKIQVLSTVRAMLSLHKRESAPYLSQALVSILKARSQFDDASHIAAEIERAVEEVVKQTVAKPASCIDGVATLLEKKSKDTANASASAGAMDSSSSEDVSGPDTPTSPSAKSPRSASTLRTSRTTVLSLITLAKYLSNKSCPPLSAGEESRLGSLAVRYLDDSDADVRKADLELCLASYSALGKEVFWARFLKGAREMHVNLIMYYLARRERRGV